MFYLQLVGGGGDGTYVHVGGGVMFRCEYFYEHQPTENSSNNSPWPQERTAATSRRKGRVRVFGQSYQSARLIAVGIRTQTAVAKEGKM